MSSCPNWSYKPISGYKNKSKLWMVTVSFETSIMAERFTLESLPVHLITQYAIQGLTQQVQAWMKKSGLTEEQMKRFAERYPPKDVNLSRYAEAVKKMTKRQREQISTKALMKMGPPQKDPEPDPGPTPSTSGAGAKPKGQVAKKSTKPSPALKMLQKRKPSQDLPLQAAKAKQPRYLTPKDEGYYQTPQPFSRTSKRLSYGKKEKKGGRRWRPSTRALREVRHWQTDVYNLIPKAPFRLLCREILQDTQIKVPRMTKRIPISEMKVYNMSEAATDALQEAGEAYLVGLLDDSNLLAIHARRQTVLRKDMELAKCIRGDDYRFRPLQ